MKSTVSKVSVIVTTILLVGCGSPDSTNRVRLAKTEPMVAECDRWTEAVCRAEIEKSSKVVDRVEEAGLVKLHYHGEKQIDPPFYVFSFDGYHRHDADEKTIQRICENRRRDVEAQLQKLGIQSLAPVQCEPWTKGMWSYLNGRFTKDAYEVVKDHWKKE